MPEETSTIQVTLTTKRQLDQLGSKGESYNDIIERLIKKGIAK